MADNAVIGALRVILGADTAQFESGLKKAQGQASSFANSVTKIVAGIGIERLLEKGIEGVVDGLKEAVKHADDLGKTAQKVGLPVEELTKLKLAADLSDVSMESLTGGLGKLSKAMLEVARGGGDAAALAFRQLNIEVTNSDGTMRSVSSVFADVAGKFGGLSDGAAKTATAMAIFGKGGKELIPLLNEGKDGLEEMMHAAENMGLVIGKNTAAQAQKLNDNIKLLDLAKQGLVNTVMAALLPALVRLSDQWVDTAKNGDFLKVASEKIVDGIKSIVTVAYQAVIADEVLGKSLVELQNAFKAFPNVAEAAKHWEEMKNIAGELPAKFKQAADTVEDFFLQMRVGGRAVKDLPFNANIAKAIEDLGFKTAVLKGNFDALAKGFPELAKGLAPLDQIKTTVTALNPQMQALNAAQLAFNGAQLTQDSLLPWQQYEQQIMRINQLFAAGAISLDTYTTASRLSAEKFGATWGQAGASIAGSFATIAGSFGEANSSMAQTAKAFAIVQAVISAYVGAAKALELPFPANIAAAASVLAQGFAFVANIKSQAVPKFQHGGSFRVGGSGGIDSQPVSFMASPQETVTVTNPGQQIGGGGPAQVTVIAGNSRDLRFLEDIIRDLNKMFRDGYVLNVKKAA